MLIILKISYASHPTKSLLAGWFIEAHYKTSLPPWSRLLPGLQWKEDLKVFFSRNPCRGFPEKPSLPDPDPPDLAKHQQERQRGHTTNSVGKCAPAPGQGPIGPFHAGPADPARRPRDAARVKVEGCAHAEDHRARRVFERGWPIQRDCRGSLRPTQSKSGRVFAIDCRTSSSSPAFRARKGGGIGPGNDKSRKTAH